MKTIITLAIILGSTFVNAQIRGSKNEARHQNLMAEYINFSCGYIDNLTEISQTEEVIQVDQGIRDINFITNLVGTKTVDQYQVEEYEISVSSKYIDGYNHSTKDYGTYIIEDITCDIK